jgi:serine/threonine protein kinase
MPFSAGDKLGPYEITALIGKGGMGEVYRAHDSRLGRDVAIKVSAARFSERFEREARLIASLNHPNICTLYDVGPNYLVMEYIEGESPKGPMPLDQALSIARQIADALEAAHEKPIIHRDLKPANIKIKPDGLVKVLDFGLAKMHEPPGEDGDTIPLGLTEAGAILGTPAYMSPEQALGKKADKRTDIWGFGIVLYELLTGERPFNGKEMGDILESVVKEQPDLSRAPVEVRRLLQSCLEKDRNKRLRDIGDVWRQLESGTEVPRQTEVRPTKLPWIVAAIAMAAALALGFLYFRAPVEAPRVIRFSVLPPEKAALAPQGPAISPDGRRLALVVTSGGQNSIWLRDLDSFAFRPVPGTEDARDPFWSPDSRFLAFFGGNKLKKIDLSVPSTPGPALTLCDCNEGIDGGSWGRGDVILLTPGYPPDGGLFQIPAGGGTLTPVTHVEAGGEVFHGVPWFLPDGRHFLYRAVHAVKEESATYVGSLDSKVRQLAFTGDGQGVYASPGYLVFTRDRILMAQPFNAAKGQVTGDAVAIAADPVGVRVNDLPLFSLSQNGVLVFASGAAGGNRQLTWLDPTGKPVGTIGQPSPVLFDEPEISPDGGTVAFETHSFDIWLHDLTRGGDSRFTFTPGRAAYPVWSPDGSQIAFGAPGAGSIVYQRATKGQAQDVALDSDARVKRPSDWSRDGRYIIEETQSAKKRHEIWVLPLFGDRKPFAYLHTEFNETGAKLSPDGRWLAYVSDKSNRNEIYVTTFPKPGTEWPISISGGGRPVWSRNGKELYFISADQKMMAVDIKPGASFEYGAPKPLFDVRIEPTGSFDVVKDGRFLVPVPTDEGAAEAIHVVINWPAELKK